MTLTIKDLIEFVLRERRGKAFEGWDEHEIGCALKRGLDHQSVLYATSIKTGEIIGVVEGVPMDNEKVFHVRNILVIPNNRAVCMRQFINIFRQWYPGWNLSAIRRGKHVVYQVDSLYNKLNKRSIV